MRGTIRNLVLLTLPTLLLCVAVAEAVLRWAIPACNFPDRVWDGRWALVRFDAAPAVRDGLFTAGFLAQQRARWHINEAGWNSEVEYAPDRAPGTLRVAVVGDSFVEALQVDCDRSFAALLRRRLGAGAEVMSFGFSGAPLSQYLQMSRYVAAVYDPDVVVVNVVHNDFDGSLVEVGREPYFLTVRTDGAAVAEVPPVPYRPAAVRRALKRSALVRYVTENLRVRNLVFRYRMGEARARYAANVDAVAIAARRDPISRATSYVVRAIVAENPGRTVLFVMDAARTEIYAGRADDVPVRWLTDLLRDACARSGAGFLDLTPAFAAHWARHRRPFETRWDGHWNEVGHEVVAEAVHRWLDDRGRRARATAAPAP